MSPDSPTRFTRSRECRDGSTQSGDRAQTTIDFTVGVSIFLLTLTFAFAFVPGLLAPFTGGVQEETVAANRVVDTLSQQLLAAPTQPYVLDSYCTKEFFDDNSPSECRFSGSTLQERIGISDRQVVNVTIKGNPDEGENDVLCWDADKGELDEQGDCTAGSDVQLTVGSSVAKQTGSTVTAYREVLLANQSVTLEVHMW